MPHRLTFRSAHDFDPTATEARLRSRFDVISESLQLLGTRYELLRPRSADDLISEEDFEADGRLPYWPEVWPSAQVLAAQLAQLDGKGMRLLELGCGLGFVSLLAAQAGFEVLATDYYSEALDFLQLNAARQNLVVPHVQTLDWRDLPQDLGKFDYVVAADVLYEKPMCGLIADAMVTYLQPGTGIGIVTDPCRMVAEKFPEFCTERKLKVQRVYETPHQKPDKIQNIRVYEVQLP